ncbi:hypothetical protein VPHK567_0148 [Vibrio phage K567]|nr:hypothetical protein MYOV011v1_p0060 [Vibrio phage 6E35.1a]
MLINKRIEQRQASDAEFEQYRRGQAARKISGELIRNLSDEKDTFLVATYVLYKEHDVDIVRKLLRYNGINATVKVVPVVGQLMDCLNKIHGIGFSVWVK